MSHSYAFHCQCCDYLFESLMRPYDPVECPNCKARELNLRELEVNACAPVSKLTLYRPKKQTDEEPTSA
jgi:DNA-directed RNA polymerase subunit RPC12/RpoP